MTMERREAGRESLPLRAAIDRLFEDAFVRFDRALGTVGSREFAVDLSETEQGFVIRAALPGVRAEDVNLAVENQMVTIEGEWGSEETREEQQWHLRERSQGRFVRTIRLPAPVDGERVEAHAENGVLTIRLPKAPAAQRRRIPIGGQGAMREGQVQKVDVGAAGRGSGANSGQATRENATPREIATGANAGPGGQAAASGQSAASTQLEPGKQPDDDDLVTRESIDSFPASDPPSYTPERI